MVFVGIILYHVQRWLFLSTFGAKLKKLIHTVHSKSNINDDPSLQVNNPNLNVKPSEKVSCTVVELTEPLLDKEENEDTEVKKQL